MKRHKVVHTKDKNFECEYCGRRFALSQYLKEHVYIHTNDKPYICGIEGCTRSFRQTGKLSLHRRAHGESERMKFSRKGAKHNLEQNISSASQKEWTELQNTKREPTLNLREGSLKSAGTLDTKKSKIKEVNWEIMSNTKNTISAECKEDFKIILRFNNAPFLDNTISLSYSERDDFLNYLEHIDTDIRYKPVLPIPEVLKKLTVKDVGKN